MMTKTEATKRAAALRKRMKGTGWKQRVWENLGWQYEVTNGPLSVFSVSNHGNEEFSCMLSDNVSDSTYGCILFHSVGCNKDPNKAVLAEVKGARKVANKLGEAVAFAEKVMA